MTTHLRDVKVGAGSVEQTIERYPKMTLAGEPTWVLSQFSSQLKTLPVRLGG